MAVSIQQLQAILQQQQKQFEAAQFNLIELFTAHLSADATPQFHHPTEAPTMVQQEVNTHSDSVQTASTESQQCNQKIVSVETIQPHKPVRRSWQCSKPKCTEEKRKVSDVIFMSNEKWRSICRSTLKPAKRVATNEFGRNMLVEGHSSLHKKVKTDNKMQLPFHAVKSEPQQLRSERVTQPTLPASFMIIKQPNDEARRTVDTSNRLLIKRRGRIHRCTTFGNTHGQLRYYCTVCRKFKTKEFYEEY